MSSIDTRCIVNHFLLGIIYVPLLNVFHIGRVFIGENDYLTQGVIKTDTFPGELLETDSKTKALKTVMDTLKYPKEKIYFQGKLSTSTSTSIDIGGTMGVGVTLGGSYSVGETRLGWTPFVPKTSK